MEGSFFHSETVQPFAQYGLAGPLFDFDGATLIYTWIALGVIALLALAGRWAIRKPDSLAGYATLSILKNCKAFVEQSSHKFEKRYYFFITALFVFIFVGSALVLIPGLEEPTKNINTTFALAIIAFFYVQREVLRAHGMRGYLQEYFKMPFTIMPLPPLTFFNVIIVLIKCIGNVVIGVLSFPIELLSKLANVLSLSLRLFGNIFGSSIMIEMFKQATTGTRLMGILSWISSYHIIAGIIATPLLLALVATISLVLSFGFGVVESLIQAFVFSILTLTYISIATQHDAASDCATQDENLHDTKNHDKKTSASH
jgi:F-type H+-transporting ATPase subunit a